MLDTIDGVVKEPPSKDEVERAKTRLMKEIDLNLRNSERIGLFLSEYIATGDWRLLFLERDRLRERDAAGCAARRGRLSEDLQSHHRRVHSRRQARPR